MASFTVTVRNDSGVTGTPGAPTGLEATENGSTRIDLTWTAPSDEGHSAITGYRIEWSADGSAPWADVVADTGSTNAAYSDTGLTAGTTRHYRVSAINSIGAGSPSNVDSATTGMGAPGKPTGLMLTVMGGTQIDLAWTAPTDIGDSAITGYRIEWSPDGSDGSWSNLVSDTGSTATAYSNTGLSSETTRHYRVSAINDDGAGSPSDTASATTDDIEGPVVTTAAVAGGDRLGIAFDETVDGSSGSAPPKSAFTVTADETGIGIGTVTVLGNSKQVLFDDLSPTIKQGQTVVVTYTDPTSGDDAKAIQDEHGNDAKSFTTGEGDVPAVTNDSNQAPVAPGKTLMPAAEAGGEDRIVLTWEPPAYNGGTAITGYLIEVSTDGSNFAPLVPNHNVTVDGKIVTRYEHTGLMAGDQRHYRISAINSAGTGPASDVVSADTVPRGTVDLSVDAASVAEGGAVAWTVTATTPDDTRPETGFEMEVEVTTTDGTAKAGTDYTALDDETRTFRRADFRRTDTGSGVYRWIATKTGTIAVTEEAEVEAEEQFALNAAIVTSGVAFTIGTGEVEIAIPNTDTWGITVTAAPAEILEGVTREVVLTAQVTPADQGCVANFPFTLRLSVGGTATDPDDYTIDAAPADMDVEACATEATWRVTLAATLDTVDDGGENVMFTPEIVGTVEFAPEAAALVPAEVAITEGPGVALSTLSLRVLEGLTNTYTVALTSQPTGTVTVTPSVSGDSDVSVSPANLIFTPMTWHVAQTVTVSTVDDDDETDDEAVIQHAVSGANYGSVTADDVEVRVQDIDGKVTGDLRMVGSENENEGRLEMFYQGDWGTVCDDRFSNWVRPRTGGPAEPNQASKVACRIMGYEGGNIVSGHDWWSRASVSEQPIWLDDVICLASVTEHNAGDGDTPVSLSDCYNAGPARHNCSHREDVGVRCTGPRTQPDDVRGPGAPQAMVESNRRAITLNFEEALAARANELPPLGAFELTIDAALTPIASLIGPEQQGLGDNQIRLVVDETLPTGMRIYVYYTDPSENNDTAAIQDEAGNDTASFFVAASQSGQPGQATERAGVAAERGVPGRARKTRRKHSDQLRACVRRTGRCDRRFLAHRSTADRRSDHHVSNEDRSIKQPALADHDHAIEQRSDHSRPARRDALRRSRDGVHPRWTWSRRSAGCRNRRPRDGDPRGGRGSDERSGRQRGLGCRRNRHSRSLVQRERDGKRTPRSRTDPCNRARRHAQGGGLHGRLRDDDARVLAHGGRRRRRSEHRTGALQRAVTERYADRRRQG